MRDFTFVHFIVVSIFILGYLAIIFEYRIKINKTAFSLLMATLIWSVLFIAGKKSREAALGWHLSHASQIIFFLLSAMTLVELIDSHKGFRIVTDMIRTTSKLKIFWLIGLLSFFISAILDNLATTIVMISLLRKLVESKEERLLLGSSVIIAANAGGAWTPIGDVTTTMLWIKGQLSTFQVIKSLFLPSFFCMFVSLFFLSFNLKRKKTFSLSERARVPKEPGANTVFCFGILGLIFVPIFKEITGLPPFMGILFAVGVLWLVTDLLHHKHEERLHLRIPYILTKIDTSGVLFFLGILLCINALETIGILKTLAGWIDIYVVNKATVVTLLGLLSAIVDNVPLVAACTGMYDLSVYPPDSPLWHMIAYAAGTGGSIFVIGSAAGVAFMGIEKVDFIWYFKKVSLAALTGYLAGMVLYLALNVF